MWETTASKLTAVVDGDLCGNPQVNIQHICTDTREDFGAQSAFIGIVGPRYDGGKFAKQAIKKGAIAIIVERNSSNIPEPPKDGAVITVDNAVEALQKIAASHRNQFNGTVVGITGSNGKTTVKEMLRTALAEDFRVTASPMSWNSQIGVARALIDMDFTADIALIECGISKPDEMKRLREMVQPDRGILVNIGRAHQKTLGGGADTAGEKAQLFTELPDDGWVIVPPSEKLARQALEQQGVEDKIVTPQTDWYEIQQVADDEVRLYEKGDESGTLLATAAYVLQEDVGIAIDAAERLGGQRSHIIRGMGQWLPAPMRLERLTTPDGVYVINDAYSADLESAVQALKALERERGEGQRYVVFGGFSQLGKARESTHAAIGKAVAISNVDRLMVVGETAEEIADASVAAGFPEEYITRVPNGDAAASWLGHVTSPGDMILVKGSRPSRLERVVDKLLTPLSPAKVFVDLEQLGANFDILRKIVGSDVGIMPVVKSFGYGLDSRRLAETFEAHGADYLGVAYPDEGVALRKHGVQLPIMVQNVLAHEVSKVVDNRLDAQVAGVELAKTLGGHASAYGRRVAVHLKVDTGMGRAGVLPHEAPELAAQLVKVPGVKLVGLMTHLAGADEAVHDAFTREQIAQFKTVHEEIRTRGIEVPWVHVANSAGAVRFPDAHCSMVRSGIGLVGYLDLDAEEQSPFQPVIRFVSKVVSVRELPEGHPVGYGLTWNASKEHRRVAVVAVGYNDGYPRHLSNKGWMSIHGYRCPVVGKVCMDVTMVDISGVTEEVIIGDEVVIYGTGADEPSLRKMAVLAETIPYELLTRLAPRVRRIYRRER